MPNKNVITPIIRVLDIITITKYFLVDKFNYIKLVQHHIYILFRYPKSGIAPRDVSKCSLCLRPYMSKLRPMMPLDEGTRDPGQSLVVSYLLDEGLIT